MQPKLVIVLDNIRSIYNVGSIFRIADCTGISKLYLIGITPHPEVSDDQRKPWVIQDTSKKIAKTALGSQAYVPWEYHSSVNTVLTGLKENGFKLFSVEISSEAQNLYKTQFPDKVALILGNEVSGVSPNTLNLTDQIIQIPMFGHKESLNVNIATAVTVYEWVRQKIMPI